jgi:dTDP-4-amino-4,6-dideoxygalactose transaminase
MNLPIPMLDLAAQNGPLREEIRAAMDRVIDSNYFILGPEVAAFEKEIGEYIEAKHVIGCANGSDALVLALKALGIGAGDEVITTTFSFFATAGSISRTGAKPIFVDIDPSSFNLDPALIESKINSKTKAIMPVHLYGQMAAMDDLVALAKKHDLKIIEDAAQAIGSRDNDRPAGTIGDVGCFSFFPSKNLGAFGDAGMVATNDDDIAANLRSLRVHGTGKVRYHYDHIGLNSRIDALQAAVLRVKLPKLAGWTVGRRENAARYNERLKDVPNIQTPAELDGMFHIYNQYTIRAKDRNGLQARLKENGIASAIYYPHPLHLQNCFDDCEGKLGDCPVTETAVQEVLSLPVFGDLSDAQFDRVCGVIRDHAEAL